MADSELEQELEQARRLGRWLADDELLVLRQQEQQALAMAQRQRQTRRKLVLLTAVCVLIPPLWPLALGLTLYLLFPQTIKRFGLVIGGLVLVAAALVVMTLLVALLAMVVAIF